MKKSKLKAKRKVTGELNVFMEIWEERPHVCFITDKEIKAHEVNINCFAHVFPKGAYPELRLEKKNILLVTPEVHHDQHTMGEEGLKAKYEWDRWINYKQQLRDELKIIG
jgi:hypothetical protein